MRCIDVREELVAYIDKELSKMGMRTIETHLSECHECTAEYERLKKAIESTHQLETIEPSVGWWEQLQERIYQTEAGTDLLAEVRSLRESVARIEKRLAQATQVKEIMTLDEVASYLQVEANKVWDLLGEIPHFQAAYELRFRKSSLDEWIRMKETESGGHLFHWEASMGWGDRLNQFEK